MASPSAILHIEYADQATAVVWVLAQVLMFVWKERLNGRVADLVMTRSMLEAQINLLMEIRHPHSTVKNKFM